MRALRDLTISTLAAAAATLTLSSGASADQLPTAASAPIRQAQVLELDTARVTAPRSVRLAARLSASLDVAFDPTRSRLLRIGETGELLAQDVGTNGRLVPGTVQQHGGYALRDPRGLAVDPTTGAVFVLDAATPRIVRIDRAPDGSLKPAASADVDLRGVGLSDPRGLALHPASGHFYVRSGETLFELTQSGALVSTRSLAGLGFADPKGMLFAPSGDLTDDPAEQSLYVADAGPSASGSSGSVRELSLQAAIAPQAIDFTSSVVRQTDAGDWNPPSPDSSGIAYVAASNRLIVTDGEVEETIAGITHFQGVNVWETTLAGGVLRTANISKLPPTSVPMTNEPNGIAFKPGSGGAARYFVTEDFGKKVYTLNPGGDALIGTADDTWTSFQTNVLNTDPEGIGYDSLDDRLFVVDGLNAEIYVYTLGGALMWHFDVERYGVLDPESVEFNASTGTLFVLSSRQTAPTVVEVTPGGALLQTIDVSAIYSAGGFHPAGLAIAPASNGSGAKRFYVVNRGIDNDIDPTAVDGTLFELTMPVIPAPTFADVPRSNPFYLYIEELFDRGITTGCGSNGSGQLLFCPTALVPREQMAAFIVRAKGLSQLTPATPTFADVPANHQFFGYIERLFEQGITTGCFNGSGQLFFCPTAFVPREQMAAFLVRAKGLSQLTPATPTFADVPANHQFFGYIERLYQQGITTGCGSNGSGQLLFCPTERVPRQQMAAFLIRAFP